jgi:hypothetical protein
VSVFGESANVDSNVVSLWLENEWKIIRKEYSDKDIFNADETALFYRLLPNKTYRLRG